MKHAWHSHPNFPDVISYISLYCLACFRLSDSGEDAKVKGMRNVGSFLSFYSRLRAFLIQRARLSRSQEQAKYCLEPRCDVVKAFILLELGNQFKICARKYGKQMRQAYFGGLCPFHSPTVGRSVAWRVTTLITAAKETNFHDDDIWLYNYQNSFGFFFLTEICQSRWGLNNNSPNLHEKTTNVRILVVVVMKALDKIWGNSRGPFAVKCLSHDVFVLFITILLTLNRKRWQEFCKLF